MAEEDASGKAEMPRPVPSKAWECGDECPLLRVPPGSLPPAHVALRRSCTGPCQPVTRSQMDMHSSDGHIRSTQGRPWVCLQLPPRLFTLCGWQAPCVCALAHMCLGDMEQVSQSGSAGGRGHVSR